MQQQYTILREGEKVLQAKRQRVRLAKEREAAYNRKDPTSRKDPEDGIVGLEDVARRGPRASWRSLTAVFLVWADPTGLGTE